jgi:prepilin-type N-terminal cleavage/methylation domain-containing protein
MSGTKLGPAQDGQRHEGGFTIIEMMISMTVFTILMVIVYTVTGVMVGHSLAAQSRGTDIDQATADIGHLADIVENAYWPLTSAFYTGSSMPYTNDCSSPPSTTGQPYGSFPYLQGPVYTQQAQDLVICTFGFGGFNTVAHTEEIKLVNAQGSPCSSGVCTMVVDRWPDPGVAGSPQQVWSIPDVQASDTSLSYHNDSNGSWSPSTTPTDTNSIVISLAIAHGRGWYSPVQRTVAMPNYGAFKL